MADLLSYLDTAPDLAPKRRRDLKSAVRRLCVLANRDPQFVAADVATLRAALRTVHAAQAGVSTKTLANIKANVLAALRLCRQESSPKGRRRPLSPDWQTLYQGLPPSLQRGLSRFIRFCSARGTAPAAVDDAVFDAFARYLRAETFVTRPNDLLRRTARLWNKAVSEVEDWPQHDLSVPSFRAPRRTIPLSELPQPFQDDVAAHLRWLQGEDLFAPHPPPRVCRPTTADLRRRHIEGAASALIAGSFDARTLSSLADLVSPDAAKTILHHYLARANNEPSQYHRDLAKTLIQIARHWVRLDAAELAALADLKRRLGPDRSGLTDKNKAMLRQFDDEANQQRLLLLPRRLFDDAARCPADDSRAAVLAQVALALEILIMAPMRMGNLMRLRLDQHAVRCGREIHLVLPGTETKGGEEIVYPLSGESVALFDAYLRRFRPRLCDGDCPWLFPTIGGKRKSQQTLSLQIRETVFERTGITLTPHQFRHLAAKLALDQQSGNYEGVRQLLAHRNLKSTTSYYTGLETSRAARQFDALIEQKRRDLEQAPTGKPRRPRRRP
jgi:integrase